MRTAYPGPIGARVLLATLAFAADLVVEHDGYRATLRLSDGVATAVEVGAQFHRPTHPLQAATRWVIDDRCAFDAQPSVATLSADGRWAAGARGNSLLLVDVTVCAPVAATRLDDGVSSLAFDGDRLVALAAARPYFFSTPALGTLPGFHVVTGSRDGPLLLDELGRAYDPTTDRLVEAIEAARPDVVEGPTGLQVVQRGRRLGAVIPVHPDASGVSADGRVLVTVDSKTITAWSVASGQSLWTTQRFSPRRPSRVTVGTRFVAIDSEGALVLDPASGSVIAMVDRRWAKFGDELVPLAQIGTRLLGGTWKAGKPNDAGEQFDAFDAIGALGQPCADPTAALAMADRVPGLGPGLRAKLARECPRGEPLPWPAAVAAPAWVRPVPTGTSCAVPVLAPSSRYTPPTGKTRLVTVKARTPERTTLQVDYVNDTGFNVGVQHDQVLLPGAEPACLAAVPAGQAMIVDPANQVLGQGEAFAMRVSAGLGPWGVKPEPADWEIDIPGSIEWIEAEATGLLVQTKERWGRVSDRGAVIETRFGRLPRAEPVEALGFRCLDGCAPVNGDEVLKSVPGAQRQRVGDGRVLWQREASWMELDDKLKVTRLFGPGMYVAMRGPLTWLAHGGRLRGYGAALDTRVGPQDRWPVVDPGPQPGEADNEAVRWKVAAGSKTVGVRVSGDVAWMAPRELPRTSPHDPPRPGWIVKKDVDWTVVHPVTGEVVSRGSAPLETLSALGGELRGVVKRAGGQHEVLDQNGKVLGPLRRRGADVLALADGGWVEVERDRAGVPSLRRDDLVAYDGNGERWRRRRLQADVVLDGGDVLLVEREGGTVTALDGRTGLVRWAFVTPGRLASVEVAP